MPEGPVVDLSPIPKFFWYSIGICILAIGAAFAMSTIRQNDMTISIASARVEMVNSAAEVDRIAGDLNQTIKGLQVENAQLRAAVQAAVDMHKPAYGPMAPVSVAKPIFMPATQPSASRPPEEGIRDLRNRAEQMYRQAGVKP